MGVGADMFRGLATLAMIGFIVCALAFFTALGGVLWLLWRGVAAVLS